jgi:hypothetical protein
VEPDQTLQFLELQQLTLVVGAVAYTQQEQLMGLLVLVVAETVHPQEILELLIEEAVEEVGYMELTPAAQAAQVL